LITLPPLPRTSQLLLQILSDPDLDMLRLAELVEQTPALAARIFGVANSAFFARATAVRDIPDAIIRVLGLHLVRDLSISFVLSQPFDLSACERFDPVLYWSGAMESATMAQLLTSQMPRADAPTPAEGYLAGLLQNLGLLALVHVVPDAMDAVFAQAGQDGAGELAEIEQRVLGLDHEAAGAELAAAWKLPPRIAAAMGPAGGPGERPVVVGLVRLGSCIRRCLRNDIDVADDEGVAAALDGLFLDAAALPLLIEKWRDRTADIAALASAFVGAGR
jgi:HD-like signal output (HDOD) protein